MSKSAIAKMLGISRETVRKYANKPEGYIPVISKAPIENLVDEYLPHVAHMLEIEKISYRYSLEDARKPIKRQITRLLLHDNSPTLFYFYELLQNAKEEFALRDSYKQLQRENTQEQNSEPSITDELKNYSDEGLQNYEALLYSDLETLSIGSQLYKDINEVYEVVNAELVRRGLLDDDVF